MDATRGPAMDALMNSAEAFSREAKKDSVYFDILREYSQNKARGMFVGGQVHVAPRIREQYAT